MECYEMSQEHQGKTVEYDHDYQSYLELEGQFLLVDNNMVSLHFNVISYYIIYHETICNVVNKT